MQILFVYLFVCPVTRNCFCSVDGFEEQCNAKRFVSRVEHFSMSFSRVQHLHLPRACIVSSMYLIWSYRCHFQTRCNRVCVDCRFASLSLPFSPFPLLVAFAHFLSCFISYSLIVFPPPPSIVLYSPRRIKKSLTVLISRVHSDKRPVGESPFGIKKKVTATSTAADGPMA